MDGPQWIRFSVAKPYWNDLAACLDPPSYTRFNNWEALAAELEFKMRDIEHIKCIRHESGSNTVIMFEQYVRKNNGGDFHQVARALDKLKSLDALQILKDKYEDIKARNAREYGPQPIPQQSTTQQSQQDIILQQQRQIQELMQQRTFYLQQQQQQQQLLLQQQQQSMLISPGQARNLNPPVQAVYIPKPEQIPHLQRKIQAHQYQNQFQETPMNLKKQSSLKAPINLYQNFNRRTDGDFSIDFADQYRPHSPQSNPSLEPQMDSLRSINQSLGVPSTPFSGPKEYPAEFTEVLARGENNVASLTPEPMVIAPIPDRPSKQTPGCSLRPELMEFTVSDNTRLSRSDIHFPVQPPPTNTMPIQQQISFQHLSNESYLSRSQMNYTRLPSGSLVRETYPVVSQPAPPTIPHGAFPIGTIAIKQEKTEDVKPMEVSKAVPDPQLHNTQPRESVIQAGPQCNSVPCASPGDLSQMSSPATVKDEEETEQRAHSLEERPTQKLLAKQLRPKRYTWPMGNKETKERQEAPKPEPPKPSPMHHVPSISVGKDSKPPPYKKKPVKVFMTYTMGPSDMKTHKKELTVLYNCLKKNDYLPFLDFKDDQEFNRNMQSWIDTRYRDANFVIVCISPQYKKDVAHHDNMSQIPQTNQGRCCRYVHNLMQSEFVDQGSTNKRFLPVLFPGSTYEDVPMWMRSIVAFRWREHWRDIMYMMLGPKDIIGKIKGNKERFTEQQEPIIRMTQTWS